MAEDPIAFTGEKRVLLPSNGPCQFNLAGQKEMSSKDVDLDVLTGASTQKRLRGGRVRRRRLTRRDELRQSRDARPNQGVFRRLAAQGFPELYLLCRTVSSFCRSAIAGSGLTSAPVIRLTGGTS